MTTANAPANAIKPLIGGRSDSRALSFTLLVWAVMFTAAVTLVTVNGRNVPCWDDWDLIPAATGHQPVTLQWLWSQHNEHRVPVPRLLLLALTRFGATDFRAGMFFNVLVTAAFALAMILTARRARGRAVYSDAFFPIALMNWGQAVNFLWCWQVQFYTSMLLAGTVLALIARATTPPRFTLVVGVGVCVVLLPLCGANGLGLVPSLALWLGYAAVLGSRSATGVELWRAIVIAAFVIAGVLLVGLYFVGYTRVPYHPSTHDPRRIIRTAMQFLTMGFGPGIVGLSFPQRIPVPFWKVISLAVIGLFPFTAGMLVMTWWKQPAERARVAGLLLFLGAMGSLALGLAMGRDGFETRYVTLSVPALCAVYLAWSMYSTQQLQTVVRAVLLATALLVLPLNTLWGWHYASDLRSRLAAFEADISAGMPPYQLIQRHSFLHPHHIIMMDYMPMLREAGIGAFRQLRNDPPFKEVSFPLTPVETHDVSWQDGVERATGKHESLTFALPADVNAAGIRLRYTFSNPRGTEPYIAVYWRSSAERAFGENSYTKYSPTGDRANWQDGTWSRLGGHVRTMHAWVCHPVQTVQIRPSIENNQMVIHELTVLVAAEQNTPH